MKSLLMLVAVLGMILLAGCAQRQPDFVVRTEEMPGNEKPASSFLIGTQKGNIAPDFSIQTIEGEAFALGETAEKKAVMLYFWATWCPYCYEDFTTVKTIDPTEDEDAIRAYQQKMGLSDIKFAKADANVLQLYNVVSTTTKFAIGSKDGENGVILWTGSGSVNEQTWNVILNGLKQSRQ